MTADEPFREFQLLEKIASLADRREWEYLARNLKKVPGPAYESDFNKHGAEGWEFVAVAGDYAIFKRPKETNEATR